MIWKKLKRALNLLSSVWKRPLPYGLISMAFLNPFASQQVKEHRKFFCKGPMQTPLSLIVACNIALWLRWIVFLAWRTTYRYVQRYGAEVESANGISKFRQFSSCIFLAIAHCIPPGSYYRFKFYLEPSSNVIWNYIYNNELPAFHLRHDNSASAKQRRLLSDKSKFANRMRLYDISISDGQLLPAGSRFADLPLRPGTNVFLKPTIGHGAIGAFNLQINNSGLPQFQDLKGNHCTGQDAVCHIEAQLAAQEYLLQPNHTNHQQFDLLQAQSNDAINIRVITRWHNGKIIPYCAFLEVPFINQDENKQYLALQIDCNSGKAITDSLDKMIHCEPDVIVLLKRIANEFTVPQWHKCLRNNQLAHGQFPDIHSIAWDNIITQDKPILLEGNNNWGIELPQMLSGGLIDSIVENEDLKNS